MTLTLNQLHPGESATVVRLMVEGINRRRLMDLGILPGTRIEAELRSPLGDPTAYRVRDTLIALRDEQARQIEIETGSKTETEIGTGIDHDKRLDGSRS